MEIIIINFSLEGLSEADYRAECDNVAPAFAAVPGLVSKVWLADSANGVYGGVYTFEDGAAVDEYLSSELAQHVASTPAFAGISVRRFGVLDGPTAVTRGLVAATA
jgi:hypothetical protein